MHSRPYNQARASTHPPPLTSLLLQNRTDPHRWFPQTTEPAREEMERTQKEDGTYGLETGSEKKE
jgi:hypothetical protein